MKYIIISIITLSIFACGPKQNDPNDMGNVEYLPKGDYIIQNTGSRHMVRCVKSDGKIYWLNDAYFKQNGIPAKDAHQFHNKTKITIH
jgi:hypothetical protein